MGQCEELLSMKDEQQQEMAASATFIDQHYGHLVDAMLVKEDLQCAYSQLIVVLEKLSKDTRWVPVSWVRSTLSLAPQEPADRALGSVRSPVPLPTTPAQITLPRKLLVWHIVQVPFNQMDMPICPSKSQIAGLTGHPDQ
ncbi:hypothetical protein P7K49_002303 [Saguinus oedipus]|uniref:Uncharacterized protein n=1 Tax=Saguinus oedipus TaxID=9490 RepID=A0ABQ9WGZ8_SAGOE|nr:hypothetical protein P7K49_002303 [Saguinus oedipus]